MPGVRVPFHARSVLRGDGNEIGANRGLEFRAVDILIFAGTRRVNNALSSPANPINIKARYIKVSTRMQMRDVRVRNVS